MYKDALLQKLREHAPAVLRAHDLTALYLTGSRARGDARDDSDVDLAVLPATPPADDLALSAEVAATLEPVLAVGRVDVVVLDLARLPLPVLGSVLRDALLVDCVDQVARVRFEVRAMSLTLEFETHAAALRAQLLERTAAGSR